MHKCPTFAVDDCPYCGEDGSCNIGNPMEECSDYIDYNYEDPNEPDMLIFVLGDDPVLRWS